MTRRSTPQAKIDEAAFPVRILALVPEHEFGNALNRMIQWLRQNIGDGEFAQHPGASSLGDATAFHFRCVEDAGRFLEAHPQIVLADGTLSAAYRSAQFLFGREEDDMCNLYSMTRTQDEMRRLFAPLPLIDSLGNMPEIAQVYPDYAAPIVRNGGAGRELAMARWGMPTPPQFLVGKKTDRGVTNIRNTKSPHWRRWLGPAHRCLVPLTAFAEPDHRSKVNVWFRLPEDRPAFFAGIWTTWASVRKLKDGETTDDLFGFLTCEPNADVRDVHPKAMPVILTEPADWETWLAAPWSEAGTLQRPMRDGVLRMGSANVLLRTLTSCRSDFAIGSQLGVHTADSDDDCTKSEDTANIVRRLNSGTLRLSRSKRPTIDDLQAEHAAFIGPPPPPQIAKFTPEDSRDWTCTGFVPVWCSC